MDEITSNSATYDTGTPIYGEDYRITTHTTTEPLPLIPSQTLRIKYMHPDTKRLEKIPQGDWIDVYADADMIIPVGEAKLIPLGFCCELPKGYEAHVAPRSSTYKNWGLEMVNSIGIIDESYCGDNDQWHAFYRCTKPNNGDHTVIKRGDKIAQFRIIEKMPQINFIEVEHLNNSNRGGIGSTGTT